jgi:Fe-S cluster assembly ATPase SufC
MVMHITSLMHKKWEKLQRLYKLHETTNFMQVYSKVLYSKVYSKVDYSKVDSQSYTRNITNLLRMAYINENLHAVQRELNKFYSGGERK